MLTVGSHLDTQAPSALLPACELGQLVVTLELLSILPPTGHG